MNKHTPGTWHRNIPPASKYPIIYAGRNTHVAQVIRSGLPDAEIEGNADLIAAAPALLAALKALTGAAEEAGWDMGDNAEILNAARDAIGKAERSAP